MGRTKRTEEVLAAVFGGVVWPAVFLIGLGFSTLGVILAACGIPVGMLVGWRMHRHIEWLWRDDGKGESESKEGEK